MQPKIPSLEVNTYHSREVRARGVLWCGSPATFYCSFNHQPTQADIKGKSGDFQSLGPVRVIHSERTVTEERTFSSVA